MFAPYLTAHASSASERTLNAANTVATLTTPPLSPSWGAAEKTLFISAAGLAHSFQPGQGTPRPNIALFPNGNSTAPEDTRSTFTSAFNNVLAPQLTGELATCIQRASTATLTQSAWTVSIFTSDMCTYALAVRTAIPASAGTPCRAASHYQGRLVVCTSSDVLQNSPTSFADAGNLPIGMEVELATIYPMGAGGAGRHLSIVFVGEFRTAITLRCSVSYDDGITYQELGDQVLSSSVYTVGQTIRVQWVPRRRKIEGVRVKFTTVSTSPTEGIAFHEAVLMFEELLGPVRAALKDRR